MNPQQFSQVMEELNAIRAAVESLNAESTIPYEIEKAFRKRLGLINMTNIIASSKSSLSEAQPVNEGGSGSYSVLKNPDAYVQFTLNNQIYYIPVFT